MASSKTRHWLLVTAGVLLFGLVGLFYLGRTTSDAVPRLVNPVQVTSVVGVEDYPTWAPDGSRLAYESNRSGNWDIWLTQLGGREAVNLTAGHEGQDRYPSWSPDGRVIAFLSERDGNWGLYTVSALGGRARNVMAALTRPYTGFKGAPQWSGDGREIAVVVRDAGKNFAQVVTLDTQAVREIALPERSTNNIYDLSWSRDGSRFAYVEATADNSEVTRLWVVSSSGGEPKPVTDGFTNDWNPTRSDDGRHLFFISNRGGTMDLWRQVVDVAGNPQGEPLPVTAGMEMRTAVFTSDGMKLVYSRGRRENVSNVWRVPILKDRLATWADAEQLTFDNAFIEYFDVSPDGGKLVLSSDRAGNQDLWSLPTDGGEMVPLTTDPTPDLGSELVSGRNRDRVLRLSDRQPGDLGDALEWRAGAKAYGSSRRGVGAHVDARKAEVL